MKKVTLLCVTWGRPLLRRRRLLLLRLLVRRLVPRWLAVAAWVALAVALVAVDPAVVAVVEVLVAVVGALVVVACSVVGDDVVNKNTRE